MDSKLALWHASMNIHILYLVVMHTKTSDRIAKHDFGCRRISSAPCRVSEWYQLIGWLCTPYQLCTKVEERRMALPQVCLRTSKCTCAAAAAVLILAMLYLIWLAAGPVQGYVLSWHAECIRVYEQGMSGCTLVECRKFGVYYLKLMHWKCIFFDIVTFSYCCFFHFEKFDVVVFFKLSVIV